MEGARENHLGIIKLRIAYTASHVGFSLKKTAQFRVLALPYTSCMILSCYLTYLNLNLICGNGKIFFRRAIMRIEREKVYKMLVQYTLVAYYLY